MKNIFLQNTKTTLFFRHFMLTILIIIFICCHFCSCSDDKSTEYYGFLLDRYSGDIIECIALISSDNYIEGFETRFGTVKLEDQIYYTERNLESFYMGNERLTLDSKFYFEKCRNAKPADHIRILNYKNLIERFCYIDGEDILHYSNCNHINNKTSVIYLANYSEAALLKIDLCEECFPDAY